jgi:hypothetical protein
MLDCCCSASLTRRDTLIASRSQDGDNGDGYRYLPNPPRFNPNDTSLWSAVPRPSETDILITVKGNLPSIRKSVYGFTAMYNGSHILLAASGGSERARADRIWMGGLFTSAVLRVLESMPSFQGWSYRMMFSFLPIP